MHYLENNPQIEICDNLDYIPFLDTGYYYNPLQSKIVLIPHS